MKFYSVNDEILNISDDFEQPILLGSEGRNQFSYLETLVSKHVRMIKWAGALYIIGVEGIEVRDMLDLSHRLNFINY